MGAYGPETRAALDHSAAGGKRSHAKPPVKPAAKRGRGAVATAPPARGRGRGAKRGALTVISEEPATPAKRRVKGAAGVCGRSAAQGDSSPQSHSAGGQLVLINDAMSSDSAGSDAAEGEAVAASARSGTGTGAALQRGGT